MSSNNSNLTSNNSLASQSSLNNTFATARFRQLTRGEPFQNEVARLGNIMNTHTGSGLLVLATHTCIDTTSHIQLNLQGGFKWHR